MAAAHFTARCCINPGTDFFALNVSSRCGLSPAASKALFVTSSTAKSCSISRARLGSSPPSPAAPRRRASLSALLFFAPRETPSSPSFAPPFRSVGFEASRETSFRARPPAPFALREPGDPPGLFLLPLGRPRCACFTAPPSPTTTPSTPFPPFVVSCSPSTPSARSLALRLPSVQTLLSSSFLNSQASRLRSVSRLPESTPLAVTAPGPSRSFMLCQLSIAVCTSSASSGSTCTPSGAKTALIFFTSAL
mmetsp:Transcript_6817/g.29018  ORF Transcript_6817/g.29018 Transcript_6817/m.29018 type:complete len:250 (-) Transcript_6817:929-1678(-)